jgi:anoctamin-10
MSVPRQRVTRSKSQQPLLDISPADTKAEAQSGLAPPIKVSSTAPGPPVPISLDHTHPSNPFNVDFVIPYDISIKGGNRTEVVAEVKEGYERLLRALEGEGGLKVGTRPAHSSTKDKKDENKKVEEVWVFIGISDDKLSELVERER